LPIKMDARKPEACEQAVQQTVDKSGQLNSLVNNGAFRMVRKDISELTIKPFTRLLKRTFLATFILHLSRDTRGGTFLAALSWLHLLGNIR